MKRPSKISVSGRPRGGIATTPLPWILPSPKSCMEGLEVAAVARPARVADCQFARSKERICSAGTNA